MREHLLQKEILYADETTLAIFLGKKSFLEWVLFYAYFEAV